ncbi:peptidase M41 [Methylobacterium sp. DB1607]|nr:peptidase M41 [Methylobacterium sp. DB1607]
MVTKEELENKMAVLLRGRAAELIVFNHHSTGAADDLRRLTDIARSMVTRYGMPPKLGSVAHEQDARSYLQGSDLSSSAWNHDFGEETGNVVDAKVKAIVNNALQRTAEILMACRNTLERAALRLLEKETLDEKELMDVAGLQSATGVTAAE